jgi:HAMP domain-containing protein
MNEYLRLQETVIDLHDIARTIDDEEVAQRIREIADEVSEVAKEVKKLQYS